MRMPCFVGAFAAACLLFALPATLRAEEGQGPADDNAVLADLNLGDHWFGPEISHKDLKGKVVLFEMWGH